ncbi:MAG: hypothetical protein JNM70_09030 [Anaerolineae bacterium]|nr:hypothetical protein [Anaerolineae bacterium]
MSLMNRYAAWLPDNPVMRAELAHLLQGQAREPGWRRGIRRLALTVGLGMAVGLFTAALLAAILQIELTDRFRQPDIRLMVIPFVIFTLLVHFGLMLSTLSLAANSIAREKQAQTWDMLVLTSMDARQIVRGKWAAVIRRQLPAYLALSALRIGAMVWFTLDFWSFSFGPFPQSPAIFPPLLNFFFFVLFITSMTLANLAFTAACGIWASAVTSRPALAMVRAIINRLALLLIPAIIIYFAINRVEVSSFFSGRFFGMMFNISFNLLDNGATESTSLIFVRHSFAEESSQIVIELGWLLASALAALGIYALWTGVALWRAQTLAVKHLETPPE